MFKSFLILIIGSFLFAAFLTPFVMSTVYTYFPHIDWPFSRVFGRVAQISAAVLIYVLRKDFNLSELKIYFIQGTAKKNIINLLIGIIITTTSVFLVIPLLVNSGVLIYSTEIDKNFNLKILKIFTAALLVSIIEESFFRVLVFSSLKLKLNVYIAAIFTSLLYAFVHFIAPVKTFKYTQFDMVAGFSYLNEIFERYLQPDIYPAFFGLFIVGMILCFVIHKSKSLYLCIGLHMGWAAGLKLVKALTILSSGVDIPNDLGGRYFLVAQPVAWLSMAVVFVILYLLSKKPRNS